MKKILFALCVLLFVVLLIPRHGAAEAPSSTPVPDALVTEALAAKQASYPAWVGDEGRFVPGYEISRDDFEMAPETPQEMGDWVMTALQLFKDNSWELYGFYSYNFGTSQIRLTNHPASDILPNLNRGATQIAFASNRDGNYEIYKMDTSGNSLVRLTSNNTIDSQPSWSFDNSQIIFVSDRDGNAEIYKMSADGLNQVRLTTDPATDISPTWSPDGTQIGFLKVSGYSASVWIMNSDGSNPHAISSYYPYAGHLRWSPDGNWLAFDGDITGDDWNENIIVRPDGTNIQQFFLSSTYLFDRWVSGWTPDSQEILANAVTYVVYEGQLYISGTSPYRVTLSTGDVGSFYGTTYDFDMNLDSESTEIDPPFSNITPLQKYSKINNFSLDWAANDVGLAGLWYVDFEHRIGNLGVWSDLTQSFGTSGSIDYSGNPGETVYFRSQAMDNAENLEAWPSVGWDTFTTFYLWSLNGHVFDNRGIGLPSPTVVLSPQALNADIAGSDGSFIRYNAVVTTTVAVSETGFEPPFPTQLISTQDKNYFWNLQPGDNQISNGDFEVNSLDAWNISGLLSTTHTIENFHIGQGAAQIGQPAFAGRGENVSNTSGLSDEPRIIRTSDNVLHAVWSDSTDIPGDPSSNVIDIFYSSKPPGLPWTDPIIFSPEHGHEAYAPNMEVGTDGTIHLVWIESVTPYAGSYGLGELKYSYKPLGGNWSLPLTLDLDMNNWYYFNTTQIALDSLGGLHVTWTTGNHGIYYLYKAPNEAWTSPFELSDESGFFAMEIDNDDRIYVVWFSDDLHFLTKTLQGNWGPVQIHQNIIGSNLYAQADPTGGVYIFYIGEGGGAWSTSYFMRLDATGNASPAYQVSTTGDYSSPLDMAIDSNDALHFAWSEYDSEAGSTYVYYRQRFANGNWSSPVYLTQSDVTSSIFTLDLRADVDGKIQTIWSALPDAPISYTDIHYMEINPSQSAWSTLSQTVILEPALHKPTLSFVYLLNTTSSWGSSPAFKVSVNQTAVYSDSFSTEDWTHTWIDLSPWISQTITITFQTNYNPEYGFAFAYLDDVTVSSWLTPVPTSVDITHIPLPSDPVQITITGENFIEGATVALNDISLENVQWIDEHTLLATVPANLPPGRYNLWVTNPGGQTSVLAGAVIAGQEVFLPIVVH